MYGRFTWWAVLTLGVFAVACGGPAKGAREGTAEAAGCTTPEAFYGSCTMEVTNKGMFCDDLTGSEFERPESAEQFCTDKKAKYSKDRCPKAGVVARCQVMCGKPTEAINTYYFGDVSDWQKSCNGAILK